DAFPSADRGSSGPCPAVWLWLPPRLPPEQLAHHADHLPIGTQLLGPTVLPGEDGGPQFGWAGGRSSIRGILLRVGEVVPRVLFPAGHAEQHHEAPGHAPAPGTGRTPRFRARRPLAADLGSGLPVG